MATRNRSLESVLPHSADSGRRWGRANNRAVLTNDFETMRPTFSAWDTHRARLGATADGRLDFGVDCAATEIEDVYVAFTKEYHVTGIQIVNEFHSRWYQYAEEWFAWRKLDTGDESRTMTAYFKPAWTDGIVGHAYVQKPGWAAESSDAEERRLCSQLDAYDDAWRSNDLAARLETIEDDTRSGIRLVEVDGDRRHRAVAVTKDELRDAWAAPELGRVLELERLHQRVTNWFVFAGYRLRLELPDRRVDRETACLLPVGPNGGFVGELSYSMEINL